MQFRVLLINLAHEVQQSGLGQSTCTPSYAKRLPVGPHQHAYLSGAPSPRLRFCRHETHTLPRSLVHYWECTDRKLVVGLYDTR